MPQLSDFTVKFGNFGLTCNGLGLFDKLEKELVIVCLDVHTLIVLIFIAAHEHEIVVNFESSI